MTWGLLPAPIGSHVTEESHLHINHLLYCSFLPPLHLAPLAQYAVSSEWDKNKSHVYCLAVSQSLSPPPSSRFVLMHFAVKVIRSQRSITNVLFLVIKALPLEKRSPSPRGAFVYFYMSRWQVHQFTFSSSKYSPQGSIIQKQENLAVTTHIITEKANMLQCKDHTKQGGDRDSVKHSLFIAGTIKWDCVKQEWKHYSINMWDSMHLCWPESDIYMKSDCFHY